MNQLIALPAPLALPTRLSGDIYSERMPEAREELFALLEAPELRNVPVVIMANKQDMPGALSASEVTRRLNLNELRNRWYMQPTTATTGEGLYEGVDQLSAMIKKVEAQERSG